MMAGQTSYPTSSRAASAIPADGDTAVALGLTTADRTPSRPATKYAAARPTSSPTRLSVCDWMVRVNPCLRTGGHAGTTLPSDDVLLLAAERRPTHPAPTNHSSQATRNVRSQRGQRMVCGAPLSWARLRQPGHTAYLSPHNAGKLRASRGRGTTVQQRGGVAMVVSEARRIGTGPRVLSRLASAGKR